MRLRDALAVCSSLLILACGSADDASWGTLQGPMGLGGGEDPPPPPASELLPPAATWLATWPTAIHPNDIAVSPADFTVAVVDAGHPTVELHLRGGTHYRSLRGFLDPRSAAYLPDGRLLVGDAGDGSVRAFDRAGRRVLALGRGAGEFQTPNDLVVHASGGLVYVADSAARAVRAYGTDGALAFAFEADHVRFPISLAVASRAGEVFVGDAGLRTVEVFGADDGVWRRTFGVQGTGEGEISFVGGIFVDGLDRVYVLEPIGGFAQVFDPQGGYLGRIGEHGSGPAQLRSPKAVTIDAYQRLLVTSYLDREVEVWGVDAYAAPVDERIVVPVAALQPRISANARSFLVAVDLTGVPVSLFPDSILLGGAVPPQSKPVWRRTGKGSLRLILRFPLAEALATAPAAVGGRVRLTLTGLARDGRLVTGDVTLTLRTAAAKGTVGQGGKKK